MKMSQALMLATSKVAIVSTMLLSATSFANMQPQLSSGESAFFTITSVKVTEQKDFAPNLAPCYLSLSECSNASQSTQALPIGSIGNIGNIAAFGQAIWKIVESGKPSSHIVSNSVSALPKENPTWNNMTDWQGPLMKSYHMEATNKLGMKVVSMDYKIMAYYGGKYQGKGQYITNLTMLTDNVSVMYGYDLQATAELTDMVNTAPEGSDPVPGCTMQMKWRVDSLTQHREGTHSVFVKGDGSLKDLQ